MLDAFQNDQLDFDDLDVSYYPELDIEYIDYIASDGINDVSNSLTVGLKRYELKNHLGNVLSVVSDLKTTDTDARLLTATDYLPFGMQMPGRKYTSSDGYRYGFNGMENDDEVNKGSGNSIDFGARMYDSRLSRFFAVDPWTDKYAWQTPYAYHRNSPIAYIDWNGFGDPPSFFSRKYWLNVGVRLGLVSANDPRVNPNSSWGGYSFASMKLRDPSYHQGKYDRNGATKNVTGSYFGDAAYKLLGGETISAAIDGDATAQSRVIMTSIVLLEGVGTLNSNAPRMVNNIKVGSSFKSRHLAKGVKVNSRPKKAGNTVGVDVDLTKDLTDINTGLYSTSKDPSLGTVYELRNGNKYFIQDGNIKPFGEGGQYYNLDAKEYSILGHLNQEGIGSKWIEKSLEHNAITKEQYNKALEVYNKINK